MMPKRQPCAAPFYSGDCAKQAEEFVAGFAVPPGPAEVVAGIVPHAGWAYSGAIAAKVFKTIAAKGPPDTLVIFGAVHSWQPRSNAIFSEGAWITPLGDVEIDSEFAHKLLDSASDLFANDISAHDMEHSIEVQLPLIKHFMPETRVVPISVPPTDNAHRAGEAVGRIAATSDKKIVAIGSTDLTHYGDNYGFTPEGYGEEAHHWMEQNDRRVIALAVEMQAEEIVEEAQSHRNACGAGAMAATVAAARQMGAQKGHLVQYTTSHDVVHSGEFQMAVGYAGIIF